MYFKSPRNIDGWVKTDSGEYKIYNINYNSICSEEAGCTWDESKRVCEQEGGYLTKITSQSENDMITGLVNRIGRNRNKFFFHIGLNDIAEEGVYRWVSDNTMMSFNNFYRGNYYIKFNHTTCKLNNYG